MVRGTRHAKFYSYHACTSVIVNGGGRNATVHDPKTYIYCLTLNTCMDANMQLTINSFRPLFHDNIFSLTFSKIPDISLTAVKFPDISRSRQVVTLIVRSGCGAGLNRRQGQQCTHLCENWLTVMCNDRGKVAVQYDRRVVKRFLRVLQQYVKLRHAAFKHASEVAWDQRAAYSCTDNKTHIIYRDLTSNASLVKHAKIMYKTKYL